MSCDNCQGSNVIQIAGRDYCTTCGQAFGNTEKTANIQAKSQNFSDKPQGDSVSNRVNSQVGGHSVVAPMVGKPSVDVQPQTQFRATNKVLDKRSGLEDTNLNQQSSTFSDPMKIGVAESTATNLSLPSKSQNVSMDYAQQFDPIPVDYQQVNPAVQSTNDQSTNQSQPPIVQESKIASVLSDDQFNDLEQSFSKNPATDIPSNNSNQFSGHQQIIQDTVSAYPVEDRYPESTVDYYQPTTELGNQYNYYSDQNPSQIANNINYQDWEYQSQPSETQQTDNYGQMIADNQLVADLAVDSNRKKNKSSSRHYLGKVKDSATGLGNRLKNISTKASEVGNGIKPNLSEKTSRLKPDLNKQASILGRDTKSRFSNFFARKVALPSPGIAKLAGSALALAVILVYVWQVNYPSLALKIAGARAGIATSVPGYLPSGWQLSREIKVEDNSLTYSLVNTADRATMAVSQQASQWTDQDLIEDYISSISDSYQALRTGGQTLYIYGDNQISWIKDGLWYRIEGDSSQLAKDQLIKVASNI
ncbi:DUF4367 domain-containing protein [Candidatus Saccharibacteria bacterium]|nr:DUF4367 domain-containing protein [Candidatus Saccharibacteria bacterium]